RDGDRPHRLRHLPRSPHGPGQARAAPASGCPPAAAAFRRVHQHWTAAARPARGSSDPAQRRRTPPQPLPPPARTGPRGSQHPTGQNYSRLFSAYHMSSFLVNSLVVVTVAVGASLVIGTLAAYALARFTLPYGMNGSALVIAMLVRSLPAILLVIPLYITLA